MTTSVCNRVCFGRWVRVRPSVPEFGVSLEGFCVREYTSVRESVFVCWVRVVFTRNCLCVY